MIRTLKNRIERIEKARHVTDEPLSLMITCSAYPDSEIDGLRVGTTIISRRPGESIEGLKARAIQSSDRTDFILLEACYHDGRVLGVDENKFERKDLDS